MNLPSSSSSAEANGSNQSHRFSRFRQGIESADSNRQAGADADAGSNPHWVRFMRRCLLLLLQPVTLLLFLTTLVVSRGMGRGEFFFFTDEMYHAMGGVFFRDALVDLPLRHPLQYAFEYYAKYPAMAIPHWPPLFHFVEGVAFLVFGLSPWVSRLTVLGFALMGTYFWYRIAEAAGPRWRAFCSGLIVVCLPWVLLYERVTMLEIPALSTCLGAIYFWMRFTGSGRGRYLWAMAAFVAVSFLVSQNAVFLVFFIVAEFVIEPRFVLFKRIHVWLALALSLAAVLPWYIFTQKTEQVLGTVATRLAGRHFSHLANLNTYSFYLEPLYKQLGLPMLILACAGVVIAILKPSRDSRLMLVWVFSGYACFCLVSEKDSRHTIMWIPPLVYLAVKAVETVCRRRALAVIACAALSLGYFVSAIRSQRPMVAGAQQAAEYVLSLPESDIVYYQGFLDADFIFFVRKLDPEKSHMVTRDKQFVVSHLGFHPRTLQNSPQDVMNFFKTWGIRYALVADKGHFSQLDPVRAAFHSDSFELIKTFPIETNLTNLQWNQIDQGDLQGHQIEVYRYRGELARTKEAVTIPMETIRHPLVIYLQRLVGHPWPN